MADREVSLGLTAKDQGAEDALRKLNKSLKETEQSAEKVGKTTTKSGKEAADGLKVAEKQGLRLQDLFGQLAAFGGVFLGATLVAKVAGFTSITAAAEETLDEFAAGVRGAGQALIDRLIPGVERASKATKELRTNFQDFLRAAQEPVSFQFFDEKIGVDLSAFDGVKGGTELLNSLGNAARTSQENVDKTIDSIKGVGPVALALDSVLQRVGLTKYEPGGSPKEIQDRREATIRAEALVRSFTAVTAGATFETEKGTFAVERWEARYQKLGETFREFVVPIRRWLTETADATDAAAESADAFQVQALSRLRLITDSQGRFDLESSRILVKSEEQLDNLNRFNKATVDRVNSGQLILGIETQIASELDRQKIRQIEIRELRGELTRGEADRAIEDITRQSQQQLIQQEAITRQYITQIRLLEQQGGITAENADRAVEMIRRLDEVARNTILNRTPERLGFFEGVRAGSRQAIDDFGDMEQRGRETGAALVGSLGQSMEDTFAGIIDGSLRGKDAFKSFAQSVLADIGRLLARLLALQIAQSAIGFIGSGSSTATPTPQTTSAAAAGAFAAKGGVFTGGIEGIESAAKGKMITQEQLLRVGDNPSKREVVIPLEGPGRGVPVEFRGNVPQQRSDLPSMRSVTENRSINVEMNLTVQALDPATAAPAVLAQMPLIQKQLAGAIINGSEIALNRAIQFTSRDTT